MVQKVISLCLVFVLAIGISPMVHPIVVGAISYWSIQVNWIFSVTRSFVRSPLGEIGPHQLPLNLIKVFSFEKKEAVIFGPYNSRRLRPPRR
jgi:hypothetical protein